MKAEEEIDGDVVVFGGNVTMPASSQIDGDLVVFGGNATVDGTVTGDIGMIGGNIKLGKTAVVEGDIGLLGGEADVAEGATVEGEVHSLNRFGFGEGEGFTIPPIPTAAPDAPAAPAPPVAPRFEHDSDFSDFGHGIFRFIKNVVEDIAVLLSLAVIGWLVAAFMPEQMKTVGDTLTRSAPFSFGVGLLTWFIAGAVGTILLITICLAFIPILGFILLAIATLFGWIVAGQVIGERLLLASGRPYPNHVVSTLVGVTALTTVAIMPIIGEIPCIGGLLSFLGGLLGIVVALTGLGAVILTRFGTQPYPPDGYSFAGRLRPPLARLPRPARIGLRPTRWPRWSEPRPTCGPELDAALAEAERDRPGNAGPAHR
ncbi:MAG: hypothetical protein HC875_37515 [Anaerolineales bacterium]|nr:hypothetical protein [Anaerolineales bacterium]